HKFFAQNMFNFITQTYPDFLNPNWTVCPIPLHWIRKLQRGFNQSEILSSLFPNKQLLLRRTKYTIPQAKLNKKTRQNNVKSAFQYQKQFVAPAQVLLIDDVCGSGSTLDAGALTLKNAGVKKVWALVLARN
ncbi:MAG TPA: hypothetical protein PLQ36_03845, partial [Candidatus Gracilibacteria bacterium]|nr:hypothetical protein [Candidatus Gracilibacteria bacterium]